MRYRLSSRERAEQGLEFLDTYRSYVINYDLGSEIVGSFVEQAGKDMDARWQRFIGILSNPTLPEDLLR